MKNKKIDIFASAKVAPPVTQDEALDKLSSYLHENIDNKALLEDFEELIGGCAIILKTKKLSRYIK